MISVILQTNVLLFCFKCWFPSNAHLVIYMQAVKFFIFFLPFLCMSSIHIYLATIMSQSLLYMIKK
jgi:hypothetical protein